MNNWRRPFGAVLASVAAICGVLGASVLGAPGAAAQSDVPITEFVTSRSYSEIFVDACLDGVLRVPGSGVVPATTQVFADGRLVATRSDAVTWTDAGGDDRCPGGVWVEHTFQLVDLENNGLPLPPPGEWVSFDAEFRITIDGGPSAGQNHRGEHEVHLNDGSIVGGIRSITSTPEGSRIRGTVVSPFTPGEAQYGLTVDGYDVSYWSGPINWNQTDPLFADLPTADPRWAALGLGPNHDFDIVVPFYGEICLQVRTSTHGGTQLGCQRTVLDGRRSVDVEQASTRPTGRIGGQSVTLVARVVDPWWAPGEPTPLMAAIVEQTGDASYVHATPTAAVGPHGTRTGVFELRIDFPFVTSGRRSVCFYDRSLTDPDGVWYDFRKFKDSDLLTCVDVYVGPNNQLPPLGNTESITNNGSTVTASGWALDVNGLSPRVILSANGLPVAVTTPVRERPDVAAVHGGDGRAGYSASVDLPKGTHRVCVQIEDTTDGSWTAPVCQQIVIK